MDKFIKVHKCGYSECTNCEKYIDKDHKCFLKRLKLNVVTARLVIRNLGKITIQLKRRIGELTQRDTYFTTSKLPKTQVPTLLPSQSHRTSKETNTYTTVLRNSVKVS